MFEYIGIDLIELEMVTVKANHNPKMRLVGESIDIHL